MGQAIQLRHPRSWGYTVGAAIVAASFFLLPQGLLAKPADPELPAVSTTAQKLNTEIKKRFENIIKKAEDVDGLEDLEEDLHKLREPMAVPLDNPHMVRNEALKKIERLSDAVKEKKSDPKYQSTNEFQRMMRALKVPEKEDAPTRKLQQALSQGDLKTAKEEIKKIQEDLATLKNEEDKEMVDDLSKKLKEIADQIEDAAKNEDIKKKLEQAGIKKEDVERMLENLSKEDLNQVKEQLQEQGMSQEQIEQAVKQLQKKQMAGSAAKELAQNLKQASQCNNPGQMGEAMSGLSQAGEQLSDLEQMQAELSQLESMDQSLENAQQEMGGDCPSCNGTGQCKGGQCGSCNGSGSSDKPGNGGQGKDPKQGRGGLAQEEQTGVDFKMERQRLHTGEGAIIGQFLVDGEQVEGEVSSELVEIVSAAERDATDNIERDRIPRQYQKAVKSYFSTVRQALEEMKDEPAKDKSEETGKESE